LRRVRRINLDTGIITTVVGTGDCTAQTAPNATIDDAALPGTQVSLSFPRDLAVDGLGGLYIADTGALPLPTAATTPQLVRELASARAFRGGTLSRGSE
jgi:hypothetical protein